MGYAYNELVAPAVLFNNPGITREEFVKYLDETHTSWRYRYNPEQAWDFYNPEYVEERYHNRLRGLASILRLPNTEQFCKFQESRIDENDIFVKPPYIIPAPPDTNYKFEVIIHKQNVVGKPKSMEGEYSFEKLKLGDFWEEPQTGNECGFVKEIIREQFIGKQRVKGDPNYQEFPEEQSPQYKYDFIMRPIREVWKSHRYKTEDKLYRSWPIFHPDNVFDWYTNSGTFYLGPYFNTDTFKWRKIENKYFFDKTTFDLIPASMNCSNAIELGYTDLILTDEAIKHKAWKLLSYKGRNYLQDFLKDFPKAKAEYERAVWDSHTLLSAKIQGLSISDFLRFRMLRD
jgi:hypothetical protein